jgi:hypothetical protein
MRIREISEIRDDLDWTETETKLAEDTGRADAIGYLDQYHARLRDELVAAVGFWNYGIAPGQS